MSLQLRKEARGVEIPPNNNGRNNIMWNCSLSLSENENDFVTSSFKKIGLILEYFFQSNIFWNFKLGSWEKIFSFPKRDFINKTLFDT